MNIGFFYDAHFFEGKLFGGSAKMEAVQSEIACSRLACDDLIATELSGKYDLLILPYGGYFPLDALANIRRFLAGGGDIIVLGSAPFSFPCFRHKGDWTVYDPHNTGFDTAFSCPNKYANLFGLSTWRVEPDSEVSRQKPFLQIRPQYRDCFGSAVRLDCRGFLYSLQVLDGGRTAVIGEAGEDSSSAPLVRDFVNLVETGSVPDNNGRVIGVGLTPAETWSNQNYRDLITGLVSTLQADRTERLPFGLRLAARIIKEKSELPLTLWRKPRAGDRNFPNLELRLEAKTGDQALWRLPLEAGNPRQGEEMGLTIPAGSLPVGAYRVILRSEARDILSACFSVLESSPTGAPIVKAKTVNNYAAFEINGRTVPALIYTFLSHDRPLDELVGNFSQTGVHIYSFSYPLMYGWKSMGEYDWSGFDELVGRILRADPHGFIYPRIFLQTPPWWDRLYPEELVRYRDGNDFVCGKLAENTWILSSGMMRFSKLGSGGFWNKTRNASITSQKWRSDTKMVLEDFVRHTHGSVYASRVFGYFFCGGGNGEWLNLTPDDGFSWEDLSAPAKKHFRDWLKNQYADNTERREKFRSIGKFAPEEIRLLPSEYMKKTNRYHHFLDDKEKVVSMANDLPPAEIEQALPNNTIRRHISKYGIFRDPRQSWDTIEYLRYYKDLFTETIAYFARVIKDASGGKSLVGTFCGYLMQEFFCEGDDGYKEFAFQQILKRAESLDSVSNPYYYYRRESITGDANCKMVHGSIKLTDKLFVDENDQRTCLTARGTNRLYGTPGEKIDGSVEALKRNFALRLTRGAGLWWFDFGNGWYDHPQLLQTIKDCFLIHQKLLSAPKPRVMTPDTLNVIYSANVYDYICSCSNWASRNCTDQIQRHFNRTGFPWEAFFLEDLPRAPRRRAWLFLNTFSIDRELRAFIDGELKKDGNVLIWLYAPGLYEGEEMALENVSGLTGFDLAWDFEWRDMHIKITDFNHPVTQGMENADLSDFGTTVYDDASTSPCGNKISPQIFCIDSDATVLGMLEAGGQAGFAVKDFGSWKSVFVSSPIVPAPVLRNILRWAGLKPVLDTGDALYTDGNLIGIHCRETGRKTIAMPGEFEMVDLFTGKKCCSKNKKVEIYLPAGATLIGALTWIFRVK